MRFRDRGGLVGPVFFWEVVRQTRRGRGLLWRLAYPALLLLLLWIFFGAGQGLTQKNASYLTEAAVHSYLTAQYLVAIFLTPIFVADVFAEDQRKRTLELLFTTHLTPRELVVGRLLGRLLHVTAVLLAGVPVLAVLQLFGGTSLGTILLNTAASLVVMFIVGAYALRSATIAKTGV